MRELELTWGQVLRIWWAACWRWWVFANLSFGVYALIVGVTLLAIGHIEWGHSNWTINGGILSTIPAGFMALRLALKAPYKNFRVKIVAAEAE